MLQTAIPSEGAPSERRSRAIGSWAPLLAVAAVAASLYASGAWRHLSLASLEIHRAALQGFVHAHAALSVAAFVGAYALVVLLSIPGATVMTLAGGLLFGAWAGAAATVLAATTGAMGVYLLARSSLGALLLARARTGNGRLERFAAGFRRDAFFYVLSLRLAPVVPFWLVNIGAGAARAPAIAFLAATLLGIAPATLIYSLVGEGFGRALSAGERPTLMRLVDPALLLPLVGLALLSLAPVILRRFVPYFRDAPHD